MVDNIPNGGISNFGTIIIKGFGFSTLVTTLMQIPYGNTKGPIHVPLNHGLTMALIEGAFIALCILMCVYLNDQAGKRFQSRCIFIVLFLLPNIAGALGLRFVPLDKHVGRYICYLLTGPYNASFVLLLSLTTANVAGHTKKVTINAVLFLGYCTGNIAGPFFYKTDESPTYPLGIWSMIVSHLIEVAAILMLRILLSWENRRRDRLHKQAPEERNLDETAFGDLTASLDS